MSDKHCISQVLKLPLHAYLIISGVNSYFFRLKEDGTGSAYDKESMAIIKLNNTTVLYLKEVTKFLALVCILREESFERKGKDFSPLNVFYLMFLLTIKYQYDFTSHLDFCVAKFV